MTIGPKTSLGIDISEHRISVALVKQSKSGIKLVKAADAEVPEGAITDFLKRVCMLSLLTFFRQP